MLLVNKEAGTLRRAREVAEFDEFDALIAQQASYSRPLTRKNEQKNACGLSTLSHLLFASAGCARLSVIVACETSGGSEYEM